MKNIFYTLSIVAAFTHNPTLYSDEVVTFFMKPYPIIASQDYSDAVAKTLENPAFIESNRIHGILQHNLGAGIFSTYHGYLGISDYNGQTTYPRKQVNPLIYLVITTRITPNIITGNTIHHWELETDTPVKIYSIERKNDIYSSLSFWDTQQVENLPTDNRIPLDSIVIFADPTYIYLPTGVTVVQDHDRPNIILPDVYVKHGIELYSNTLYVLNIRQFFGPVKFMQKKREKDYSTLVVPHPGY